MELRATSALSTSILAIMSAQAHAVERTQETASQKELREAEPALEVSVVTVQKREQPASHGLISISVRGAESCSEKSVSNLQALAATVPNDRIA